jgi:multidrug efflux pump subunit AcrA (membrane-fusion protein)
MNRFYWSTLLSLTAILASLVNPVFAAQEGNVVASAVIVPSQVTELGFVTSALIKEIIVKEGQQVQAGQTLAILDIPELQFAVTAAEAALRSAQGEEKVQSYRRVKDRRNGRVFFDVVPPEVRQIAHARVQQAQATLEVAQATLAQDTLVAPQEATVVSVNVVPGEFVQQSQVAVTLATLDSLQIETTDLSERDITKVKIGDHVNILIEALNAQSTGKVIRISPIAYLLGGDVIYTVTVSLDEQPDGLLWGMTAEVIIGE